MSTRLSGQGLMAQAIYGLTNNFAVLSAGASGGLTLDQIVNPSDEVNKNNIRHLLIIVLLLICIITSVYSVYKDFEIIHKLDEQEERYEQSKQDFEDFSEKLLDSKNKDE